MASLILLGLALGLMLLLQLRRQGKRLQRLEARTDALAARLEVLIEQRLSSLTLDAPAAPLPPEPDAPPPLEAPPREQALRPPPAAPPSPEPLPPAPPVPAQPPPPPRQAWHRLERLLIENWTGILGVVVVVAGVTFLAIHLALQMGPFARFLLTAGVAGGMALPSLLWGGHPRWRHLSQWLRSGAAALFLFACAAAGGLPGLGLRWIQDPAAALALLGLAMAVNLALVRRAPDQTVAALHVAVNLVPLALVPQNGLTLAIASVVTVIGGLLPRHPRWNAHQLMVTWSYALFHATWILQCTEALRQDDALRGGAALAAVLVFGGGVLRQHARAVALPRLTPLPAAVLSSQWGALILALLLYPRTPSLRAGALALAAAASLLLARQARRSGWRWLYLADTLVAQGLVMAALLALAPLANQGLLLPAALLGETLLFLALGVREREPLIRRIGWGLAAAAAVGLALIGALGSLTPGALPPGPSLQDALVLQGGAALLTLAQIQLRRRGVPLPLPPLLGWLAAALALVGAAVVAPRDAQAPLALAALGALLLVERRQPAPGLRGGGAVAVLGVHGLGGIALLVEQPLAPATLAARLLPLALLALLLWVLAAWRCPAGRWSAGHLGASDRAGRLGLDLLGFDAALGIWLWLAPISPLMPAVGWLLLSLLALEAANRLRRPDGVHALAIGLLLLIAFGLNWLLVISQSPALIEPLGVPLRARLLVELFGLAVLLHWWGFQPRGSLRRSRLWQAVHPCFLEVVLLAVVVTVLSEVSTLWRPLAWTLLALALLSEPLRRLFAARIRLYALLVHWLASASIVALLGTAETAAQDWFAQPQTIALAAIGLQVLFAVASHRWLPAEDLQQPGGWPVLGRIGRLVAVHPDRWVGYPVFLAVAWYLSVRYDHALLTLLWAAEAFVIFVLSAVLRDNQFRAVALIALAACLVRLVAIDMAQADLGLRGLVFIGVGLLMVAMNAIVSRFRERFR